MEQAGNLLGRRLADGALVVLPIGDPGSLHAAQLLAEKGLGPPVRLPRMLEPKARRHGGRNLLGQVRLEIIHRPAVLLGRPGHFDRIRRSFSIGLPGHFGPD